MIDYDEKERWIASLKPGDEVAVRTGTTDNITSVISVTARGRVNMATGEQFKPSGKKITSSKWDNAWLEPVTPEIRATIERKKLVSDVWSELVKLNRNIIKGLSDERLKALLAVLKQ